MMTVRIIISQKLEPVFEMFLVGQRWLMGQLVSLEFGIFKGKFNFTGMMAGVNGFKLGFGLFEKYILYFL